MTEREMQLQGLATEWRTMAYTWRDCALYALAVGATGEEPQYTYEKDMQVIPTFGVLPYWGGGERHPAVSPAPGGPGAGGGAAPAGAVLCEPGLRISVPPPHPGGEGVLRLPGCAHRPL